MLHVKNVSFAYDEISVLSNINLKVDEGENIAVIGESGSGKSTLLKLIYGEYDLKNGSILWNDTKILGPKYNLVVGYDFIKAVTQEFDLMPFITVEENIGKFLSNFYPDEKHERIKELLAVVELENFAKTKVKNLSGGQKQRVAIARALAKEPQLLLLDEPFSHIDNFKKQPLRRKLFGYLKTNNITCIVATHDKNDVLGYADQIIVLHDTKIIVNDTPEKLFKNPQNSLIASFFGEFNFLEGHGIVYAHQLKLVNQSNIKAVVKHSYFKGSYYLIEADIDGKNLFFEHNKSLEKHVEVYLKIKL